jgi:hypothetical protein
MARAPQTEDRRKWGQEYEAECARLEAKYGIPYEKLPEPLRYPKPDHPRVTNARRFDKFDLRYGPSSIGWRHERIWYLVQLTRIRLAEIEVRKLRAKRTGRGKPLHRKAHVDALYRHEAREWREEL